MAAKKTSKKLRKGKKLEATKALSLSGSCCNGKHIPEVTIQC